MANVTQILASLVLLAGCDVLPPDSLPVLDLEITTVRILFSELNSNDFPAGPVFEGWFSDPDGLGGERPKVKTLILRPDKQYQGAVLFEDRRLATPVSVNPWLDQHAEQVLITYKIRFDDDKGGQLILERSDVDRFGLLTGLQFSASASTPALTTGAIRIRLTRPGQDEKSTNNPTDFALVDVVIPFLILAPP